MRNKSSTFEDFDKIFQDYYQNIYRVCLAILKSPHLAEDACQETFYKVLKKLHTFDHKSSIKTWITTISVNICKDLMKKKSFQEISTEDYPYEPFSENYKQIETKVTVMDAVNNLPSDLRMVVVLYYYQDLTQKEIAKILKTPETTVVYRLRKAKVLLEETLKEGYYE